MKKTIKIIILFLIVLSVCSLVATLLRGEHHSNGRTFNYRVSLNSSHNLGNNIYMMEWDEGARIIVNCSNKSGRTCYGGAYLIPTYENGHDSIGNFTEYVVTAKSDEKWVIVKTDNFQSKQHKYYIINKDYDSNEMTTEEIINTKIDCFTDSSEFANKCLENGISIKW